MGETKNCPKIIFGVQKHIYFLSKNCFVFVVVMVVVLYLLFKVVMVVVTFKVVK